MSPIHVPDHSDLTVDHLACARGERVLFRDFDLTLAPGSAARVLGANGRGKTTLLRTLAGLRRPHAGRVCWNGVDVHAQHDAYAGQLLFLAHENALNPNLTAIENLTLLQKLRGGSLHIQPALDDLGIGRARFRPCGHLSAGQRRRVALAQLLLSDAPLWLLDEPAAALDVSGRAKLGECIAAHATAGGSVLFTTHEPLALPGVSVIGVELP